MLKLTKHTALIAIILSLGLKPAALLAAVPSGYYNPADGKTGAELRLALHNIIDGHTEISYDDVWDAFGTTDLKDNGKIWDMYTGIEFTYPDDQSAGTEVYTTYNREHSWPKSWANETYPMYDDVFHLYPVQAYSNSHRSDLPYGEVDPGQVTYTSENGTRKGDARSGLGYTGTVFEPVDEYKGDMARTYFYISTRYYTEDANWDSSGMTVRSEIRDWAVDMLLDWHHLDPVSQKELDRNEAVYAIQGNRNPFIDYPYFADSIWTSSDTSSGPLPPEPTVLSAGDIAITGVNMDNPDQISVVFLVDITDGSEIKFTDNGWKSDNSWRSGEGIHTWTAPAAYAAGTEIVIDLLGPLLSTDGDQVIAFQNSSDMIAAINNEGAHVWQADATSSNTSALPQGLTNGVNCAALDETDNIQYNRIVTSGSKEELLAAINDYRNWSGNNSAPLLLSSSGFTVSDAPLPINLEYFDARAEKGRVRLDWRTETESENAHFLLYRDGEVIAQIDGAGTTTEPHSYAYTDQYVIPGRTYSYQLADVSFDGKETKHARVEVEVKAEYVDQDYNIGSAYPNPFNPVTLIPLNLTGDAAVTATLYDMSGRPLKELQNGTLSAGSHDIRIDGANLSTGIYFVHVNINNAVHVQKIALMK